MSKRGHIPVRTCVGCLAKKKKEEMIGLTLRPEGDVQFQKRISSRGRGIYLCPDLGCLTKAKKRKREIRFLEEIEFQALIEMDR